MSLASLAQAIDTRPQRLLWMIGAWHVLFWVLAPTLGYRSLPLDTLELLGWGQAWQLGYYKHPPLGPWIGEAFLQLSGERLASLYLLAQLGMLVCFAYVYACGRLFLDPLRAALAVALLQGSYFHTFLTPNFNMNSLQLPVWAGLSYHFLRAFREGATLHWLLCGVFAALALLSKYSGLLLWACCGLALIASAQGRHRLKSPGPWLGACLAAVLLAPHGAWLIDHWALPWQYLRSFDPGPASWTQHIVEPLRFAVGALAGLLFSAGLWLILWRRTEGAREAPPDRWVLVWLVFGPLLLSMLYGLISGSRLKSTWAFPFFSLIGVLWMMRIPPERARARLPALLLGLVGVIAVTCSAHLAYKTRWGDSKTRFDGVALATAAEGYWRRHQTSALRIVIGDHIDTALLSAYVEGRPSMLIDGNMTLSPWVSPSDLARHGALWVCNSVRRCPEAPPQLRAIESIEVDGQSYRFGVLPATIAEGSNAGPSPLAAESEGDA